MTTQTKSDTVPYVKAMIGEFLESENMMSVEFSTPCPAILTSPIIAGKDGFAPLNIFSTFSKYAVPDCLVSLPVGAVLSPVCRTMTLFGTELASAQFYVAAFYQK